MCYHFSHSVVSDSLRPHELQYTRPPCPSPIPRVHSNSRPSSRWCHPAISSCRPLLLLLPVPPSIRVFSSESTLHMRWPNYWSLSFNIITSKASILRHSAFFTVQLSHPYMTIGKTIALTRWTLVSNVTSACEYAIYVGHNFPSKE